MMRCATALSSLVRSSSRTPNLRVSDWAIPPSPSLHLLPFSARPPPSWSATALCAPHTRPPPPCCRVAPHVQPSAP
eukprot:7768-Prymnesium_polylepis.1